jgi:hypothetical protein
MTRNGDEDDRLRERAAMMGSTTSHVRWLLVGLLFLLSSVAFLDRVNI